jgi:parvulin-like peptidyl-prolyl isomerase
MDTSLDFGDSNISIDLVIAQLHRFKLFPQLIREIIADDLIAEMAVAGGIELGAAAEDRQQRELRFQQFKVAKWGDEVEAYFQAHRVDFDRVLISIIQVQDADLIQELFFRIESGEQSFAETALDYSAGIHAQNGGIWGPLLWRDLTPEIRQVVAKLAVGELSSPFQFDGCDTLIRLDRQEAAGLDDTRYNFILDRLFSTWLSPQLALKIEAMIPRDKVWSNGWKPQDLLAQLALDPVQVLQHLVQSPLLFNYLREFIIDNTLKIWINSPEFKSIQSRINPKLICQNRRENLLKIYKNSRFSPLVKSRFLEQKSTLDRVMFSTIQVKDFKIAQELYYRIKEGEKYFAPLAMLYSDSPTAQSGGLIGPIPVSQLYPQIQSYLHGLTPKQLSPIFKVDEDYVFLRIDRWLPVQLNPQIEQRLVDELFEKWIQTQVINLADRVRVITAEPVVMIGDREDHQSSSLAISQSFDFDSDGTDPVVPISSIFFPKFSTSGEVLPPNLLARKHVGTKSSFSLPQSPDPFDKSDRI